MLVEQYSDFTTEPCSPQFRGSIAAEAAVLELAKFAEFGKFAKNQQPPQTLPN